MADVMLRSLLQAVQFALRLEFHDLESGAMALHCAHHSLLDNQTKSHTSSYILLSAAQQHSKKQELEDIIDIMEHHHRYADARTYPTVMWQTVCRHGTFLEYFIVTVRHNYDSRNIRKPESFCTAYILGDSTEQSIEVSGIIDTIESLNNTVNAEIRIRTCYSVKVAYCDPYSDIAVGEIVREVVEHTTETR